MTINVWLNTSNDDVMTALLVTGGRRHIKVQSCEGSGGQQQIKKMGNDVLTKYLGWMPLIYMGISQCRYNEMKIMQ